MKRKLLLFALSFAFALSGCNHQEVKSIENIVKTNTVDLTDYYTIYYSDGTTYDFVIINGKDGINGLEGKDGHTPKIEISKNNTWIIDGVDSNIKAQVDPVIPTIGENGNWFINDIDTGYSARGEAASISINDEGYWVINGITTVYKANGNVDDIKDKLSYIFDIKSDSFVFEKETLSNPSFSYVTSTFSGWTGVIGRVEKVDTISFRIRARDKAINSVKCYLNIKDKNGANIETKMLNVNVLPFEEKDLYFQLSKPYINENNDLLYFGYACDNFVDVYSEFGSAAYLVGEESIQAYITNGKQPDSLSDFINVYQDPSRYIYVRLGYMKDVYVPNQNFLDMIREKVEVNLSDEYYLSVDDNFQLFYRGVVKAVNPYNYHIRIKTKKGTVYPRYYEWKPTAEDVGGYNFDLEVYDNNYNLVGKDSSKLIVNKAVENKEKQNILCVGDSLTSGGVWVNEGVTRFKDELKLDYINTIGSKTYKNAKYEGYGGWTADTYLSDKSPFYNTETKAIDFKTYLTKFNETHLDYVYLFLSWNGHRNVNENYTVDSPYFKKIRTLMDLIHQDFPSCRIRLFGLQMPSQNGGMGTNYGTGYPYSDSYGMLLTAFNFNKTLEALSNLKSYSSFVNYIDVAGQFDTDYNMPSTNKPVNNRSDETEVIGTNGVHPSMNGYLQIGDAFFRSLVNDFRE